MVRIEKVDPSVLQSGYKRTKWQEVLDRFEREGHDFEGMRAYMEVALVAIHNIAVDSQMPKKWEKKICENLDQEIARILQVTEAMSAEDIGAAVVQFAEKAGGEADAAPREP